MATIARAELAGIPFTRNLHVTQDGKSISFPHENRVRVILKLDDATGDTSFQAAETAHYAVETLPHLPLKGRIFDHGLQSPSLSNVLKRGASTPYVDTSESIIVRGGDLTSPLKTTGFTFAVTRKLIEEARIDEQTKEQHGEEVAAAFQGEKERPLKTEGFGFSPHWMMEERRKKIVLARQAKEQMQNQYPEFP